MWHNSLALHFSRMQMSEPVRSDIKQNLCSSLGKSLCDAHVGITTGTVIVQRIQGKWVAPSNKPNRIISSRKNGSDVRKDSFRQFIYCTALPSSPLDLVYSMYFAYAGYGKHHANSCTSHQPALYCRHILQPIFPVNLLTRAAAAGTAHVVWTSNMLESQPIKGKCRRDICRKKPKLDHFQDLSKTATWLSGRRRCMWHGRMSLQNHR